MTFTVAVDVRCDWCHRAIVSMHPGLQRVPLHQLDRAVDALSVRLVEDQGGWQHGYPVGGPPGCALHLCRACKNRGTPPKALPAKTKRGRK